MEKTDKIVILESLGYDQQQHSSIFRCQCQCGAIINCRKQDIAKRMKKGCATCSQRYVDYLGKTIDGYRIVKKTEKRRGSNIIWLAVCVACSAKKEFASDILQTKKLKKCECVRRREFLLNNKIDPQLINQMRNT